MVPSRDIILSVLIPVYNVADYLPNLFACLERQDMVQTEIIFIDDGSTDNSGYLLDAQADNPNYVILHQKNSGVAAARNFGLEIAQGRYVCFIDPDDSISDNYIKILRNTAITTDADLLITDWWEKKPNRITQITLRGQIAIENISAEQVCRYILTSDLILGSLWAKVFAAKLFENNRFPLQRTCSDFVSSLTAIVNAESVKYVPNVHYTYTVDRIGSLQNGKDEQDLNDFLYAHKEASKLITHKFPQLASLVDLDMLRARQQVCVSVCTSTKIPNSSRKRIFKHFQHGLWRSVPYIWRSNVSFRSKIMFTFVAISYYATNFILVLRKRK